MKKILLLITLVFSLSLSGCIKEEIPAETYKIELVSQSLINKTYIVNDVYAIDTIYTGKNAYDNPKFTVNLKTYSTNKFNTKIYKSITKINYLNDSIEV